MKLYNTANSRRDDGRRRDEDSCDRWYERPSPAPGEQPVNKHPVLVENYNTIDYRGFVFIVHDVYGLMLLRCTRKKNKPPHWQVPGGHVDEKDFVQAAQCFPNDRDAQLIYAGKIGTARELYEETGIDLRQQLDRFEPAALRVEPKLNKKGERVLTNEYKHRLFYFLSIRDDDFLKPSETLGITPMGTEAKHLKLKLSVEHSGFLFQPEPTEAAELLKLHSGGKITEALLMAMDKDNQGSRSGEPSSSSAVQAAMSSPSPARKTDNKPSAGSTAAPSAGGTPIKPPAITTEGNNPQTSEPVVTPSPAAASASAPNNVQESSACCASSLDGSCESTDNGTGTSSRRRRGKREKDSSKPILNSVVEVQHPPPPQPSLDIPPPKEQKGLWSCFKFCT